MRIKLTTFGMLGAGGDNNPKSESPPELHTSRARRQIIQSVEARLNERRTPGEKVADYLVKAFGNFRFALLNLFFFTAWIGINLGYIPAIPVFDSPPFIMLINVVSLEAIFLSIFVLISQNREAKISDLREEIDLQVNMIAEQEVTKIIRLLAYLMKHFDIPYEKDPELKRMMKPLDTKEIQQELERQLGLPHKW